MKMNRKGFTLVEIMIVVAIIGILAAIAIPNFLKSRKESQKNACIANMKQLYGAAEQWKLAGNATPPTMANLIDSSAGYIKAKRALVCPANTSANYTIDDNGVSCGNADAVTLGHVLLQ